MLLYRNLLTIMSVKHLQTHILKSFSSNVTNFKLPCVFVSQKPTFHLLYLFLHPHLKPHTLITVDHEGRFVNLHVSVVCVCVSE